MGEAIAKLCFGVLLIYAGNLLINDSARDIKEEIDQRKVWADASRSPEPVPTEFEQRRRGRRHRHEPEEVKEESSDAD